MAFTALTEAQIVANLINTYASLITTNDDINQGSVARSVFEAFAQELKRLYQNVQESAAETQKTAVYTMFNFQLLPAQAAYTKVTMTAGTALTADVTIPSGTLVGVPGTSVQYRTPADITWPSGSTSESVRIVCTQTGTIGNQRANTITQLITSITGLNNVTVANPKGVISGRDLETEDERTDRFKEWINSLHRGDANSLVYGAKQAKLIDDYGYIDEQVTKAQLVESNGSNTLFIDNGTYDTSSALVSKCQQVIDGYVDENGVKQIGYKGAGIPTTVQAATLQGVAIAIKATPRSGYTFTMIEQSIIDNVTLLIQSLDVGESLTLSTLNLAVGNTPGVLNFQITGPAADVTPIAGVVLKIDTLNVTEL